MKKNKRTLIVYQMYEENEITEIKKILRSVFFILAHSLE